MSVTARTHVWMDSLGEWSWPGRAAEAVESLPLPPSWVPALPPRLEPATAAVGASGASLSRPTRPSPWLVVATGLLSAIVSLAALVALRGPVSLERLLGLRSSAQPTAVAPAIQAAAPAAALPTLVAGSQDAAGSSVDTATYDSAALGATGTFHVYIPPGFASTSQRYPVLYLLHGNNQSATAFLQIGLQEQLDRLITRHAIPPLIAVMIQGGPGANNWRNRYERYALEVQQLIDRMLPTLATRGQRGIAGDSMGGYGAMNIALGHPQRFAIVESWLGFFDGLDGELRAARQTIERQGLHAYVYGGASDTIANPSENAPFAARLRAAGASAHGAVYAGGHTMETLEAHLGRMLLYAGRALADDAAPKPAATIATRSASSGAAA
jgi:enterochelin esterase-like enzyme